MDMVEKSSVLVDKTCREIGQIPKVVTFNSKAAENINNLEKYGENIELNHGTNRFSERTVIIPTRSGKCNDERRRVFRQKKEFSQKHNSEINTGDGHNLHYTELNIENFEKNHRLFSSATARLENHTSKRKEPDQHVSKSDVDALRHPSGSENIVWFDGSTRNCLFQTLEKDDDASSRRRLNKEEMPSGIFRRTQSRQYELLAKDNEFEKLTEESDSDYTLSLSNSDSDGKKGMISISDSDECDTDLEIDENFGKVPVDLSDTNICKDVYLKYCRRWKIAPQKAFVNSLPGKSVSLRNRSLGSRALVPACKALKDNLRVERINLEGTDIQAAGSRHVAEMLLDNINITHVNLSNNDLGLRGAQVIGHVIAVTKYITHLNLSGNKFDNTCAWFLSEGISTNTTLGNLDLSNNCLEEKSGKIIGKALVINKRLKILNLGWNKLGGKGSVAIFHALMFNKTLESLNISWNGIGYEGSVAMSKCFKKNQTLKDIDVSNNRIDWLGAPLIALGLKNNATLSKLKIGYNPLTTSGVMELLEAASSELNVLSLLDATEICVVGEADLLAATISRKRKFTFLHGRIVPSHDKLGEKQGREINPMLRVIEYLRLLGLRPLELLKSFDKTASFELPRQEFVDQIKRVGVKLHPYEIEALANSISAKGYDRNIINYRKLALAVREVVQEERLRKMKEKEEWKQIKNYHEKILRRGTLDHISLRRSSSLDTGEKDSNRVSMLLTPDESHSSLRSNRLNNIPMSLCTPLDSTGARRNKRNRKRTIIRRKRKH